MSRDPKSTYYDEGGIETIDIIEAKLTFEEFCGYLKGNALKYGCRMAFKGTETRDAEKFAFYSKWLEEKLASRDATKEVEPKFTTTVSHGYSALDFSPLPAHPDCEFQPMPGDAGKDGGFECLFCGYSFMPGSRKHTIMCKKLSRYYVPPTGGRNT